MTSEVEPFRAISLSHLAHTLKAEGRSIIHMEFGQPSTGAPKSAIAVAHKVLDADPMGYWQSQPLKARIAQMYHDRYGVKVEPVQVILTCGASPALVLALALKFEAGARVALARPGYVAYRNTLRALHMQPVEIPCGPETRYQITAAAIAALEPAPDGVIIASPANPTGTIIHPDELQAIAEVCRARGIAIVSDEIYHGLTYTEAARSIVEFDRDALVISSFSKYFSMAGWRLGWLLAPRNKVSKAIAYMGNLFLTPPSLSQHAALAALDATDELEGHLDTYRRNRALLLEALPQMGLRSIAPPDGAFYIYASVAHLTEDSFGFCEQLLRDTGVAAAPGVDFDPALGREFVRFSFAVSTPEVEEALRRMKPWFAEKAGAVQQIEGVGAAR